MRSAVFSVISRPSMMQGPAMRTIGFPPPILILPILITASKYKKKRGISKRRGRMVIAHLQNSIAYLAASAYFGATMPAIRAYAKINLGLRILRLRDDGYHDLETVFHRINLFDELELLSADSISMECSQAQLPSDERNLSYRAALLLPQEQCSPVAEISFV